MRLPSLCVIAGLILAAMELVNPPAVSAGPRTWTSEDGAHTIEAELVESTADRVLLRKPNGDIIPVPLIRLSRADREFVAARRQAAMQAKPFATPVAAPPVAVPLPVVKPVEKPAETAAENPPVEPEIDITRIRTYDRLNDAASRCATAEQVVRLFQKFLAQPNLHEDEILAAKNYLPAWEAKAAKKMVRVGTNWLEPAQAAKVRDTAQAMVKEGRDLLDAGQVDGARATLRNASKADPEDAHADFLIGLSYALVSHDAANARTSFTECLRRRPGYLPAMNNLALANVRLRAYDEALHQWQAALASGPASREIVQNLGRLAALADKKVLPLSHAMLRRVIDLQASASGGKTYDPRVGWLYMAYDPSDVQGSERSSSARRRELRPGEDRWCMHCNGTGTMHCPNRECKSGKVPGGTARSVTQVGGSPKFHVDKQVWKTCPVCHGDKKVDCPDCVKGVENGLY